MSVSVSTFPDPPGPDEHHANPPQDGKSPGRTVDDLPDGGGDDDDLGEDEAPPA